MQTQRDHVHAHEFQMGRMSSALILGEPTTAETPGQRTIIGLLVGVAIGALILGGYLVYGWLVPGGNTSWKATGTIIVEKESGSRYLYLGGQLRPVLNMTSARLLAGPQATVKLVSRNSLTGTPRGAAVGLRDAPQVLPVPGEIVAGPWLACPAGTEPGARTSPVGFNLNPGAPHQPLGPDRFVLVSGGKTTYLLWREHKHRVADAAVIVALGLAGHTPVQAPASWLNDLPDGEPVGLPNLAGTGSNGPRIGGRSYPVGELFTLPAATGSEQLFVLAKDGLAPINRTMFQLQQTVTGRPVELSAADVVAAPRSSNRSLVDKLTDLGSATAADSRGKALCVRQAPTSPEKIGSTVVFTEPVSAGLGPDGKARVALRPGSGMVVYGVPLPPGERTPVPFLVTEDGVRYQLGDNAMSSLGLGGSVVPVPAALLAAMPAGPVLSRDAMVKGA